ncbi:small ubiquitin-related modifier 3 isoform X2 [Physeter macrocephalus]|uniref:Small ubiquitin-related modifier 3 isoform X2 n=1 Tax=Physeter macrocephalus TaxID=9755 RepID=A0A9W2WTI2_PHYMC|nr:small ubiquitin-related modifier 3 isoform X2 [Physeter catodon]
MSGDVFVALLESEWWLRLGLRPSTFASVGPLPSTQFSFQTMRDSCPLFTSFHDKEPMLVCPPTVTRQTARPACGVWVTCEHDCALGPLGPLVLSDASAQSLPQSLSFQTLLLRGDHFQLQLFFSLFFGLVNETDSIQV